MRNHPDFNHEKKLWQQGYQFVAGLDEAGRGPLAGPVIAAAVLIQGNNSPKAELSSGQPPLKLRGGEPRGQRGEGVKPRVERRGRKAALRRGGHTPLRGALLELRDSKQFSARQREAWYKVLTTNDDIKWGIGIVSEKIIDKINILEATKLAMKRALDNLKEKPGRPMIDFLLLDGNFLLSGINVNQKAVPRGDEKIWSCAAASVIAKVTRDRLMEKYDKKYPAYGFAKHKGYGTKKHLASLKCHGPCAIHRRSFAPVRDESLCGKIK